MYNELIIIWNELFCITRWCPHFKICLKWRLTHFAVELFIYGIKSWTFIIIFIEDWRI